MSELWPWLAVAAAGALHGLNPANGWLLAAGWGWRASGRSLAVPALMPIALGHVASVLLVAASVALVLPIDRRMLMWLAGGLFALAGFTHFNHRVPEAARGPAGHAGLALASFIASIGQGAGMMLVPALTPLCAVGGLGAGVAASPLLAAIGAVLVHMAVMLAVTAVVARGIRQLLRHDVSHASCSASADAATRRPGCWR